MVIENPQIFTWQKSDRSSEFSKKVRRGGGKEGRVGRGQGHGRGWGSGNDKH